MLQAKTEEQRRKIEEILFDVSFWDVADGTGIHIDDYVSFDKLAELVDYLRSVNKPKKAELDMSIVAPEMRQAVDTWIAYKKERHESYKPTGFKQFLRGIDKKLKQYSEQEITDLMHLCMERNYQGLLWDLMKEVKKSSDGNSGKTQTGEGIYDDFAKDYFAKRGIKV
jgi:hypothetical protein